MFFKNFSNKFFLKSFNKKQLLMFSYIQNSHIIIYKTKSLFMNIYWKVYFDLITLLFFRKFCGIFYIFKELFLKKNKINIFF